LEMRPTEVVAAQLPTTVGSAMNFPGFGGHLR
jgi:hypothetical protein